MAVTAGAAWLFDPKQGAGRRAQLREQLAGTGAQLREKAGKANPAGGPAVPPSGGTPSGRPDPSVVAPLADLGHGQPFGEEADPAEAPPGPASSSGSAVIGG